MSLKFTCTRGLSGSGKTTWAKEQVKQANGGTVIVCKDDIRNCLWDGEYSKGREALVKKIRNAMIITALEDGKNVISADINFDNHIEDMKKIVTEWAKANDKIVYFELKDFTDTPLSVCIERDAKRANSLGEKIIRQQYSRWIKPNLPVKAPLIQDESLPKVAVFDMDGTLTLGPHDRSPYEWHKVGQDKVNNMVKNLAQTYNLMDYTILIVSGRDGICRQETMQWLEDNEIPYDKLFMREAGDNRPDDIIKEEIIDRDILPNYNIKMWVDDRLKVCRMLHKKGIPLLRVGDPESDF